MTAREMLDHARAIGYPSEWSRRLRIDPDPWQRELLDSQAPNIIVNCSRQVGKSTTTAIKVAHHAANTPNALVLITSPTIRQSKELLIKARHFIEEAGVEMVRENTEALEFENNTRVFALPGSEKTIRGFSGVTLLIVDEAARVQDELYAAIRPMLAVSGGQTILLSTPFGKRGFFYREWEYAGDTWERYTVTAYDCPRISDEFLESERRRIGTYFFEQEYMCQFLEDDMQVIRWADIERAFLTPAEPLIENAEALDDIEPLEV